MRAVKQLKSWQAWVVTAVALWAWTFALLEILKWFRDWF
jgi:hypothetical protein